mmetsp:Transcript_8918/g.24290  ORF Transcript_8918/g.24290 Transcript_8918/m.24290 type:complete len:485 (-) Transcript_8918:1458-2912(-)
MPEASVKLPSLPLRGSAVAGRESGREEGEAETNRTTTTGRRSIRRFSLSFDKEGLEGDDAKEKGKREEKLDLYAESFKQQEEATSLPSRNPESRRKIESSSLPAASVIMTEVNREKVKRVLLQREDEREADDLILVLSFLKGVKAFTKLPWEKQIDMCAVMTYHKCEPNEVVFLQGEKGTHFYIIINGEIVLYRKEKERRVADTKKAQDSTNEVHDDSVDSENEEAENSKILEQSRILMRLHEGESFGDLALMNDAPRMASAVAGENGGAELIAISSVDYNSILKDWSEKIATQKLSFLAKVPVLMGLSQQTLQRLATDFLPCKFKDGDIIFKQGDSPDYVYVIISGKCRLTKTVKLVKEAALDAARKPQAQQGNLFQSQHRRLSKEGIESASNLHTITKTFDMSELSGREIFGETEVLDNSFRRVSEVGMVFQPCVHGNYILLLQTVGDIGSVCWLDEGSENIQAALLGKAARFAAVEAPRVR